MFRKTLVTAAALTAFDANAGPTAEQEPRSAATCQDLRAKLDDLEKMLHIENEWLDPLNPNSDDFVSQQEQCDIAAAKLTARRYVQTAHVYLAQVCTDPGYIASFAHMLVALLR
jgi:hypothetical protein